MSRIKLLIVIYLVLIGQSYAINNLQLRGCIDDSTNEEHGQCHKQLQECFGIKECGAEFNLLFNDCQMPLNDSDFDIECFKLGQKRAEHPKNLELIKCFDEVCGMFGGQPLADMELIQKNIMENLEKQQEQIEKQRSKNENEEFLCVKNALTDPEKCYKLADDCDEECSEDLNKLKTCTGETEQCIYDIEAALPHLVNEKAIKLTNCLYKLCYQNNKKENSDEPVKNEENQQVVNEEL
ncbi:hypothetical protein TTHERM_00520890 (macronuclear) [Tetrahymena thermophila SB210]|uniref:Transmembrane protein n=1 Tax=Tetrahymena thermophila (strain SB210) TaxID=312017 RepID=I7LUJ6_TETTS|nr:hypothetical protein TTHERM_00520890 [Tetrahymena thermophila SB210]EAR94121.2 hypothetical protein TTHERM_00520890 [Tetrahymena thermophila SB210]|eukprot:XP_001014366.2 hypothetical protein TTHERM_00520890 [Tetrahymena thermophila SB210]